MKKLINAIMDYLIKELPDLLSDGKVKTRNVKYGLGQAIPGENQLIIIENDIDDFIQNLGSFEPYSTVTFNFIWFGNRDYLNSLENANRIMRTLAKYSRDINEKLISHQINKMSYNGQVDNLSVFSAEATFVWNDII